jgi:hypothetical protein
MSTWCSSTTRSSRARPCRDKGRIYAENVRGLQSRRAWRRMNGPSSGRSQAAVRAKSKSHGGDNATSQSGAERRTASSRETHGYLSDAPQPGTCRCPGEASSQTGASRADRQTYGLTERQTDGPEEHQGWLAQRARLVLKFGSTSRLHRVAHTNRAMSCGLVRVEVVVFRFGGYCDVDLQQGLQQRI